MAGKYEGVAAQIQQKYPKAKYFHCAAHALNLCVVSASNVQAIRNMHGTMQEICLFFNLSPKQQAELEKNITEKGESRRKKLVNLCKTRWVARIEAYESFSDLLSAVVSTMECISTGAGWNAESSQKAASLLTAITQCEFLMAFVVVKNGLGYLKGLTVSLQSHLQDICNVYAEVITVKHVLLQIRSDIEVQHKKWLTMRSPLVKALMHQRYLFHDNVNDKHKEQIFLLIHYRRVISIPFLDQMNCWHISISDFQIHTQRQ